MTLGTRRSLRIPAELDHVADVRHLIREVAGACDAPKPCMDDLVQAVDEAATNVILHGYRGEPGWVEVAAWFTPLYHLVQVTRGLADGPGPIVLVHAGILLAISAALFAIPVRAVRRRLVA